MWYNEVGMKKERGLIVVPGLGRPDRLQTVVANLHMLDIHNKELYKYTDRHGNDVQLLWDCIVYTYADQRHKVFI